MSQELLTWRKATIQLRWADAGSRKAALRLERAVLAREVEKGRMIATRLRGGTQRKHLRITMSAIAKWLPEFRRSRVDSLASALADYHADTDHRIREMVSSQLAEHVEPRLDELWERDEKLAEEIEGIAKRVSSLTAAVHTARRPPQNKHE